MDDGHGRDGSAHRSHALVELVLGLVRADDRPRRAVVDHLLVGLLRTRRRLEHDGQNKTREESSKIGRLRQRGRVATIRRVGRTLIGRLESSETETLIGRFEPKEARSASQPKDAPDRR